MSNLCRSCGKDFRSLSGFDAHRVGKHEPLQRRCLTTEELEAKGYKTNQQGKWVMPNPEGPEKWLRKAEKATSEGGRPSTKP